MTQQIKLSNNDRLFLLKAIMLAEIDNSVYKYLIQHQDIFTSIETGKIGLLPKEYVDARSEEDKKWPTEDDQIKLNKILQLIRTTPTTSEIDKSPSEIFSLVGPLEVEIPESKEFNKLAGNDTAKALKILGNFEWDLESRARSLTASISQGVEKIKSGEIVLDQTDDESELNKLRTEINTEIEVLEKYSEIENYKDTVLKISPEFFKLFPPLEEKCISLLNKDGLEAKFLNTALKLAGQEFLIQYFNIDYFNNFDNFDRVLGSLDIERLVSTPNIVPILDKALIFFGPEHSQHFDQLVNLIKSRRLLETSGSQEYHDKIASLYISEPDPNRKSKILELLKNPFISNSAKSILITDWIAKKDYVNLTEALKNEHLVKMFLSQPFFQQIRNFINTEADLNDPNCQLLIQEMFENHLEKLNLLEPEFIRNFLNKIDVVVSDQNIVNVYVKLLTSDKFISTLQQKKTNKVFAETLQVLWTKADPVHKRKITNYKKRLGVIISDKKPKGK